MRDVFFQDHALERARDLRGHRHDEAVDHADADQDFDGGDARDERADAERERQQRALRARDHVRAPAMRLVVAHAAARLLAQVAPDLRHVAAERVARHDFRGARARQLDRHHALQLAGPVGHHQHAVGELHGLGDVVGDQQAGLLQLMLDLQHLVAEQQPRLLVERAERLVHQQDLRLGGERARDRDALAHAAGQLGRIALLEAVEADEIDEMARALDALRLRPCRRSRAGRRRSR